MWTSFFGGGENAFQIYNLKIKFGIFKYCVRVDKKYHNFFICKNSAAGPTCTHRVRQMYRRVNTFLWPQNVAEWVE